MISVERSTLSTKLPWLQFYTSDWRNDPKLSMCKPSTRGIWIDALSAMHDDGRSGTLSGTLCQLTRVLRCSESELHDALDDLTATGAADVERRNGIVTLVNRRMSREAKERAANKIRQERHRDGKACHDNNNGAVTPPSRLSVSDSESGSLAFEKEEPEKRPIEERFADFWRVYPRKEAKQPALKAFRRVDPDERTLRAMITWVGRAAVSEQWQDPTKVPHAATVLNQARWNEDPPPPKKPDIRPDLVGAADYEPPDPNVCEHCAGTGRVLVVTSDGQVLGRAPWSAARQIHLAGPGEKTHTFRCSCPAGRAHMHLEPEPMEDIA